MLFSKKILVIVAVFVLNLGLVYSQNPFAFVKEYNANGVSKTLINDIEARIIDARNLKDTNKLVIHLIEKALFYQLNGNYQGSNRIYYQAIKQAKNISFNQALGYSYLGLSEINFRTGNYNHSLENCIQASEIFKELNDTSNYINANMLVGQVYLGLSKFNDAFEVYNMALNYAAESNDSITIGKLLSHFGAANVLSNNFELGMDYYKKSLAINKIINNKMSEATNYANIGELLMYQRNYNSAISHLKKALHILDSLNFTSGIIFINYTLGETYSKVGNSKLAMHHFNTSLKLIVEIGESREKGYVYKLLSDHYIRNNRHQKGLEYYKLHISEKDSLQNLSSVLYIDELKQKYNTELQNQELATILTEHALQQEKLVSNNKTIRLQYLTLLLVLVGLISSVLFTVHFSRSQRKLKEANSTKDALFSIIGHDLKGPLGNIKHIIDIVQNSPENLREKYINLLKDPADKTYNLLEDLLTWSQTLKGKTITNQTTVDINEVANEVIKIVKPHAKSKGVIITNNLKPEARILADKNQLATILRNLISNAVKFSNKSDEVSINQIIVGKKLQLNVTDSGIGIDQKNIKQILAKNSFLSTYGTNNEKGTGIGLKICQQFIKEHGSRLQIESKLGQGSTFSFQLTLIK